MNWYFQDSKGIQGPLTEIQLLSILATEFEVTASVRQENSNWVPAETAKAKFAKLETAGVYLRTDDKIYGPFTAKRADELKAKEPQKFDAYKTGKNGKWVPFTTANSIQPKTVELSEATPPPPPLPPAQKSPDSKRATSERETKGAEHLKSGFSEFLKGLRILTANVLRFVANVLAPQSITTAGTVSLNSASGTFDPAMPPTRRKGRSVRNMMLFATWSVTILFVGVVLGRLVDNPLKQVQGIGGFPGLSSSGSQSMSKSEFRKKFRKLDEDEMNGLDLVSIKGLVSNFGKPYKTQTVGNRGYWYWRCRDGAMQLVVHATSFDEDAEWIITIYELNDY